MNLWISISIALLALGCSSESSDSNASGGSSGGGTGGAASGGTSSGGSGGVGVGGSGVGGSATGGSAGSSAGGSGGGTPIVFDYYIAVDGSDSNPGTLESPWALTAVDSKRSLYAGKNVGVLDGTYDLRTLVGPPATNNDYNGAWLRVSGGPDAEHRTVFMSVNPRGAILDGDRHSGTPHQSAIIGATGEGNVVIEGFKITRSNCSAVIISDADNVVLQNNWLDDNDYEYLVGGPGQNSGSVRILASSSLLIRNNLITHFDATGDGHRGTGIMALGPGGGMSDSIIENNSIIMTEGGSPSCGIHIKNPTNNRNTVRYNYIEANFGTPLLWHGNTEDDSGVESCHHNVIVGPGGYGSIASEGADNHREIYNNTLVGGPDLSLGVRLFDDNGSVDFFNNIIVRGTTDYRGDVNIASIPSLGVWDYNFYGDGNPGVVVSVGAGPDTKYESLAAWKTASGKDQHALNASAPGFVDTGVRAEKYKLTGASAASNMGTSDGTGTGTPCDVGAWGNGAPAVIGSDF